MQGRSSFRASGFGLQVAGRRECGDHVITTKHVGTAAPAVQAAARLGTLCCLIDFHSCTQTLFANFNLERILREICQVREGASLTENDRPRLRSAISRGRRERNRGAVVGYAGIVGDGESVRANFSCPDPKISESVLRVTLGIYFRQHPVQDNQTQTTTAKEEENNSDCGQQLLS